MKAIKILSVMLCLVASMTFAACGDDDGGEPPMDEEEEFYPGDDSSGDESDEPASGYYVLLSATEESSNLGITSNQFSNPVYDVEYMRGRYTTVLKSYAGCSLTYSSNSVSFSDGSMDEEYTIDEYSEYVSSAQFGRHENHEYEYDSKGRLITETIRYGSEEWEKTFLYDNRFNVIEYQYSKSGEELYKAEIEYTSIPAKTIPMQSLETFTGNPFCMNWVLTEAGFFGNSIPLYLVSSIVVTDLSDGSEVEYEYDYTLNRMGYVVEMTEMKYTVSKTYISTWYFEWKNADRPSYTNWLFSDETSPYYRYL